MDATACRRRCGRRDRAPRFRSTSGSAAPCASASSTPSSTATATSFRSTPTASTIPSDSRRSSSSSNSSDLVLGARFAGTGEYEVRGPRKWAMLMLSGILSRLARTRLTDTTSGFRASGPRAVRLFAAHYPAEYLGDTVESLVIASRASLRGEPGGRRHAAPRGRTPLPQPVQGGDLPGPRGHGAVRRAASSARHPALGGVDPMTIATYLLGVFSALLTLGVVIEMLRRRRLRERHAVWWLLAGIAGADRRTVSRHPRLGGGPRGRRGADEPHLLRQHGGAVPGVDPAQRRTHRPRDQDPRRSPRRPPCSSCASTSSRGRSRNSRDLHRSPHLRARWGVFAGAWIALALLASAWAIASPISSGPDEPAHLIKAASVVRGELVGPQGSYGNEVTVPKYVAWRTPRRASCSILKCRRTVRRRSSATRRTGHGNDHGGLLQPDLLRDGRLADARSSRTRSASTRCASSARSSPLASSPWPLCSYRPGAGRPFPSRAHRAITPMVIYVNGLVNPSSFEISGPSRHSWRCSRSSPRPTNGCYGNGHDSRGRLGARANTRTISPLWIALAILSPSFC